MSKHIKNSAVIQATGGLRGQWKKIRRNPYPVQSREASLRKWCLYWELEHENKPIPKGLRELPPGQDREKNLCTLSARERRPVWLEHGDSQELPMRWGWRRKHHAGTCWPGLQVKVSFFLAMESCRGLWGVFKQGKRKQFLIHFSLVGAN